MADPPSPRHAAPVDRRWSRRALVGLNVVVAVLLVGGASVYGYARYRLSTVRTGSSTGLSHVAAPAHGSSLPAENILLIGNETRAGQTMVNFGNPAQLTGTLSDVIMVLHLDPAARTVSILSIPRDLFTPMPAGSPVGSYQKVDAALNDGKLGPNNLAAAIEQDFGIPINHYVEVDFDGFLQTVDALGGIRLDFPERLYDATSGLNIATTGCQLLDGRQALALVRSRHLQYDPPGVSSADPSAWPSDPESDLARIVRDHTFVRALTLRAQSEGLSNPLRLNDFLSAVLDQLTVDPGLRSQLVGLAATYAHLNPQAAPASTLPVTQVTGSDGSGYYFDGYDMGDVEFPDEPADLDTIRAWDPSALPAPAAPTRVVVSDITGSASHGGDVAAALAADGLPAVAGAPADVPGSPSETLVEYHPGSQAEGLDVLEHLSGAVILQPDAAVPAGTVQVMAGSVLSVLGAAGASPAPSSTSSTSSTAGTSGTGGSSTPSAAPTPGGQAPSPAADQLTPYDPRTC